MKYCDFDTLLSQTIIKGELKLLSGLNIGGTDLDMVDSPVARISLNGVETPYLPGSSIKGVLRSEIERVFRSLGEDICDVPNVCNPDRDDTKSEYCMVCGIFGGMSLAGHIRISDALPTSLKVNVGVKPGVAINRTLGIAQSGALYNMEIIHPSQTFGFTMIIDNITLIEDGKKSTEDIRSKAIWYILSRLMAGHLSFGKKSTSGLGDVKLETLKIEVITPSKEDFISRKNYVVDSDGIEVSIEEV